MEAVWVPKVGGAMVGLDRNVGGNCNMLQLEQLKLCADSGLSKKMSSLKNSYDFLTNYISWYMNWVFIRITFPDKESDTLKCSSEPLKQIQIFFGNVYEIV